MCCFSAEPVEGDERAMRANTFQISLLDGNQCDCDELNVVWLQLQLQLQLLTICDVCSLLQGSTLLLHILLLPLLCCLQGPQISEWKLTILIFFPYFGK